MPEKEGKYPCQYCNKPCRNPQSREMHEKACPKNPDRHIAKTGGEEGTNVEFEAETSPKLETEKEIPKEPEFSEEQKREIAEEDEALRKFPTILKLIQQGGKIEAVIAHQRGQEEQIANLSKKLDLMTEAIKSAMSQPQTKAPVTQVGTPKTGADVGAALDAGLKADKGQSPGSSDLTQTKMDQLKREAEAQSTEVQTGQTQPGQAQPDAATLAAMQQAGNVPEWMQKAMLLGTLSQQFLPLLNALKGQPMEAAQTPDDMKALDRTFANMSSLFTLALKMTDNVTREARKRVMDELKDTYNFVPKPGSGVVPETQPTQTSEQASSEQPTEEPE